MDFQTFGRVLVAMGIGIAVVGALMWLGGRMGLGSLPGDLRFDTRAGSCFIPIVSSIVLSLVLTLVLNLILRLFR